MAGLHDRSSTCWALHFRTSFSQNVLQHSIEVAFLSGMMAEMTGLDADLRGVAVCCTTLARPPITSWREGTPRSAPDLLKRHGERR